MGKIENAEEITNADWTGVDTKDSAIEGIIQLLLESIGEDVNRIGLKDTPKRVRRMLSEIFKGYDITSYPKVTIFSNKKDGVDYNQMIIDKGYFFSQCEHHMVPFFGQYSLAYIPNKSVIGLSKIARIVDWHSSKLQVQERLTTDIVDDLQSKLNPKGIMLVMSARHLCKEMRGVKKVGGEMITSEVRGVFENDINARQEFLQLTNRKSN